jgi:hypothetical protein
VHTCRDTSIYTFMYGVCIQFWTTLDIIQENRRQAMHATTFMVVSLTTSCDDKHERIHFLPKPNPEPCTLIQILKARP